MYLCVKMKLFVVFLSLIVSMSTERIKLHTYSPDKMYCYNFFPLRKDFLEFNVKAPSTIAVILSNDYSVKPPYYEIVIGAYGNTASVIRKTQDANYIQRHNATVVSQNVYQKFWVSINNTEESISVGKSKTGPFLYLQDPNFVKMSYFGVTTGYTVQGDWDFDYDMIR